MDNQQTDSRELPEYIRSEANQQTGTRELQTCLRPEVNQQTGTIELKHLRSHASQHTDTRE